MKGTVKLHVPPSPALEILTNKVDLYHTLSIAGDGFLLTSSGCLFHRMGGRIEKPWAVIDAWRFTLCGGTIKGWELEITT